MESTKSRIYYLEVLRVIACLSVIMIHTCTTFVEHDFNSSNFWIANILDGLARIAVPVFVMISGALLLDENYQYNTEKLIKHITRMILFFVFWSLIYCVIYKIIWPIFSGGIHNEFIKIIGTFIKGHYHLWYIYLLIGLYLILPLLRLWVKKDNKKYIEYFIILALIFTFLIPQIISIGSNYSNLFEHINEIIENINLKYVGGYTAYFLLGWYLNNFEIKRKNIVYYLGIISLIITIFGTYILSISLGKSVRMYGNLMLNIFFQALCIFVFIKDKIEKNSFKESKVISLISKNSLGIYAMHVMIVKLTYEVLNSIKLDIALISIPITFVTAFIVSFIVTSIFRKLPVLKKVV